MPEERERCPIDDPTGPTEDPLAYDWDGRRRKWILKPYYHAWAEAHGLQLERS